MRIRKGLPMGLPTVRGSAERLILRAMPGLDLRPKIYFPNGKYSVRV